MKVTVNGKTHDLAEEKISISDILKSNNVTKPEMVSIQLNEKFVNPDQFALTRLKDNDEIDFIYFMGGGQN